MHPIAKRGEIAAKRAELDALDVAAFELRDRRCGDTHRLGNVSLRNPDSGSNILDRRVGSNEPGDPGIDACPLIRIDEVVERVTFEQL